MVMGRRRGLRKERKKERKNWEIKLGQNNTSSNRRQKKRREEMSSSSAEVAVGGGGEEETSVKVEDSKDLQQQSKALDKLTDRHEDHRQLDSTRVQEAMASIAASKEADLNAMRLREKELAAVKINPAEVDIIANELELDRKVAERSLREHKGDAVAAIRHLIHI